MESRIPLPISPSSREAEEDPAGEAWALVGFVLYGPKKKCNLTLVACWDVEGDDMVGHI